MNILRAKIYNMAKIYSTRYFLDDLFKNLKLYPSNRNAATVSLGVCDHFNSK